MTSLQDLINRANESKTTVENEVVKAAVEQRKQDALNSIVSDCTFFLTQAEQQLKSDVKLLRALRKRETVQKEHIKKLERALLYFGETGNPLPLSKIARIPFYDFLHKLGISTDDLKDDDWKVPDDWQPAA